MSVEQPRVLVLFGTGEHARVVADAAAAGGWTVAGALGDGPASAGLRHLGPDGALARVRAELPGCRFLLALGGLAARQEIAARVGELPWAVVVHPAASVSEAATLHPGVFVGAGAVVNTGAVVHRQAIVNSAAVVEHDVVVGPFTHLAPGAVVGGGAVLGEAVLIGLGARVRDHRRVGDGAVVGMGAVVVSDVAPGTTVLGVPARPAPASRR